MKTPPDAAGSAKEAEAQKLADRLSAKYGDCDVELYYGGQPIYYYIVSVE